MMEIHTWQGSQRKDPRFAAIDHPAPQFYYILIDYSIFIASIICPAVLVSQLWSLSYEAIRFLTRKGSIWADHPNMDLQSCIPLGCLEYPKVFSKP
jgi:hypothetical protein